MRCGEKPATEALEQRVKPMTDDRLRGFIQQAMRPLDKCELKRSAAPNLRVEKMSLNTDGVAGDQHTGGVW